MSSQTGKQVPIDPTRSKIRIEFEDKDLDVCDSDMDGFVTVRVYRSTAVGGHVFRVTLWLAQDSPVRFKNVLRLTHISKLGPIDLAEVFVSSTLGDRLSALYKCMIVTLLVNRAVVKLAYDERGRIVFKLVVGDFWLVGYPTKEQKRRFIVVTKE